MIKKSPTSLTEAFQSVFESSLPEGGSTRN